MGRRGKGEGVDGHQVDTEAQPSVMGVGTEKR